MLVNYLTESNFITLSAEYPFDNDVNFQNRSIFVDGRLSVCVSPVLEGLKDFRKNNYSFLYLTKQINLPAITDFYAPKIDESVDVGKIFFINTTPPSSTKYLKFDTNIDDQEFLAINYDQSFYPEDSTVFNNPLNTFHFIKKSPTLCNIMYAYAGKEYFLNFNPTTFNINFTILSAFSEMKDYTRNFYYTRDEETGLFTLQCRIQGEGYRVIYNTATNRLGLSTLDDISLTDSRCLFYLTAADTFDAPEITIDWGSYEKKFNQNSLSINNTRSYFDTKNNFLLHTEYFKNNNLTQRQYNIISLKNQLNVKNLSTRGNVFKQEDDVTNRDYVTVFSGGRQEKGHDTLTLQYQTYTFPYEFKPGKTTWFHTPQSMWPYKRVNVNQTSLIDAGAVGSNHPLRSDKIFKKLGNYKKTANFGNSSSEQTGQWLCSWLSAAPDISIKPKWVDRFYNPTLLTPLQALSATPGTITYFPSYESYLETGIYDKPSSLTFEPGNLYAYTRFGKIDAINNINVFSPFLQQKNFTNFYRLDNKPLQPEVSDNLSTYEFTGNEYCTIDVSQFNEELNTFSLAFWAARSNWDTPCGFQLAGNFTDYGIGIFNYENVTPFLMFVSSKTKAVLSYNENLDLLDTYNIETASNDTVINVARRDALNSFHVFTDTGTVYELNLQEALIDSNRLFKTIVDVENDIINAYILFSDNTIGIVNLLTNEFSQSAITAYIDRPVGIFNPTGNKIAVNNSQVFLLCTYGNTYPRSIDKYIYYLSQDRNLKVYDTTLAGTSSVSVSAVLTDGKKYTCFNIDKNNNIWCANKSQIDVYRQYSLLDRTLSVQLSSIVPNPLILNIGFSSNFINSKIEESTFITFSGTTTGTYFVSKINEHGHITKTISIPSDNYVNIDPSNYNFYYDKPATQLNEYKFKCRLYNQFNTEDSKILQLNIDSKNLNPGYHHFVVTVNSLAGVARLYLDGEVFSTQTFTPGKYVFTPILADNILTGVTPFYNNTLLTNYLTHTSNTNTKKYYTVSDLNIQNFYWYNKEFDYYDINMLLREKIQPDTLIWDVPAGRRAYNETIARYFINKIPGQKSPNLNVYVNSSILDQACKDAVEAKIIETINAALPAYARLNKLIWTTNLPTLSAASLQPYYPGNILTNAGLER